MMETQHEYQTFSRYMDNEDSEQVEVEAREEWEEKLLHDHILFYFMARSYMEEEGVWGSFLDFAWDMHKRTLEPAGGWNR